MGRRLFSFSSLILVICSFVPVGILSGLIAFLNLLCVALLPIIEEDCQFYEGFRYFNMNDPISSLKWSEEDANYNYQLCFQRLTIPLDELNNEIDAIIADSR